MLDACQEPTLDTDRGRRGDIREEEEDKKKERERLHVHAMATWEAVMLPLHHEDKVV